MHRTTHVTPIVLLIVAVLMTSACSPGGGKNDPLQVVENPVAAKPADSPKQDAKPAGRVLREDGEISALAVHPVTRVLAVAAVDGGRSSVAFYGPDATKAISRVRVPDRVERLIPDGEKGFAGTVPGQDRVVYLAPDEDIVGETVLDGGPADLTDQGTRRLVALREERAIAVLEYEQRIKTIAGVLASADQVLDVGGDVVVLDRLRSALFDVDVDEGTIGVGLRVGDGAANAVIDRFGRVLVTDARSSALLAFSAGPLLLRQRYPVPGGAFGIAYDAERDLAWVTLTARNEVVAFDVAGGEPTERMRFATVRQPNSVTVDKRTGHVVVGSAADEGLQVIEP